MAAHAQIVATETRVVVMPPPPVPVVYLPRPAPPPPKPQDLITAFSVFVSGSALIFVLLLPTGWAFCWFVAVLIFVGIAALIFGFGLFMLWSEKFFRSR
jgi:hypothetical protein